MAKAIVFDKPEKIAPVLDLSKAPRAVCDCGGTSFCLYTAEKAHVISCPTCGRAFTLDGDQWTRPLTAEEEKATTEIEIAEVAGVRV